jgi:hypothetical protein
VKDAIVGTDLSTVTTNVAAAVFPYESVSVSPVIVTVFEVENDVILQPPVQPLLLPEPPE